MYQDFSQYICGAEMAVRGNKYKIALWTKNADKEILENIGRDLKNFSKTLSMDFRWHDNKKAINVRLN